MVEWTGGPHAAEVLQELQMLAAEDEVTCAPSPGNITDVEDFSAGGVSFQVRGMPQSWETIKVTQLVEVSSGRT